MAEHHRLLRSVAGAAAVVVALTTITLAAVYVAASESTEQVAADAATYGRAESLLAAATAVQSRLSETMTALAAAATGVDQRRLTDAAGALAAAEERAAALADDVGNLPAVDGFLAHATELFDVLASDRLPSDSALAALDVAYEKLVVDVIVVRQESARAVNAARSQAGTLVTAARSFVVIVVPLLAVYGSYRSLRNRQRRRELEMKLQVETRFRNDKDRLIASVGHELRTPLTGILGLAEVLREGRRTFSSGERNRMIETIADESLELAHRVDNLVVVSRLGSDVLTTKLEAVDVRATVSKVTYGWETRARSRLIVTGNAFAIADRRHLEQVIRNLLSNAARHGGGDIEVRIHRGSMVVATEVRDGGVGLPFEAPKQRLDQGSSLPIGLGLGLTTARRLTEVMGGSFEYRRVEGVTVFTLKLPVAPLIAEDESSQGDLTLDPHRLRPSRSDIEAAIAGHSIAVVYEPIVCLDPADRGTVRGYEALARFPFAGPLNWFREAADLEMGVDLELAAIQRAVSGFHPQGEVDFLSVNVSDDTLVSYGLRQALSGLPPSRIVLELSEEAAIASYEATSQVVHGLQREGYRLALDDVGQGETDLWHVLRMEPSMIKLDTAIVRDVANVAGLRAMVSGIVAFGTALGAVIVAEGIESPDTAECLHELGVHLGQGHIYRDGNLATEAVGSTADATGSPVEGPAAPARRSGATPVGSARAPADGESG